jgi:hypothetical protein
MDKITDIESKIMDYYNKYCKEKGLIFIKSEIRTENDSEIYYDFIFRFSEIEMHVTFASDDDDEDIKRRLKLVLRENNIYL